MLTCVRVQGARLAAEEALGKVSGAPQVEIADLRSLDADNAEEGAGRDIERTSLPRRDDRLVHFRHADARCLEQGGVEWRQPVGGIDDAQERRLAALAASAGGGVCGKRAMTNPVERNRSRRVGRGRRSLRRRLASLPFLSAILCAGANTSRGSWRGRRRRMRLGAGDRAEGRDPEPTGRPIAM